MKTENCGVCGFKGELKETPKSGYYLECIHCRTKGLVATTELDAIDKWNAEVNYIRRMIIQSKIITEKGEKALQSEREQCCKDICAYCDNKLPVERDLGFEHGKFWKHRLPSNNTLDQWRECKAWAIRERVWKKIFKDG